MKVAIYERISTDRQNIETQNRDIQQFVSSKGWEVAEVYSDIGISGSKAKRPALDKLLKDGFHGKFQAIVVWDISRFSRSVLDALQLLQRFEQMGIRFVAIKQTFDTDTPLGKSFFVLAAMFAEMERAILIERVRAGMARAKLEGKQIGRRAKKIDIDRIKRLKEEGCSLRKISKMICVPKSTIAKYLKLSINIID